MNSIHSTNEIQLRISSQRLRERGIRKIVDSTFDHDSVLPSQPGIRYNYPITIQKNLDPRLVPSPNASIYTPY